MITRRKLHGVLAMRGLMMGAAMAAMLAAAPALADVKAGVDAWARGDFKAAVEQWRAPAVAGDADAQFNLGQAYKLGRGVPEDPVLAEQWFRRAALQGHAQAEDNYGLALFQGGKKADALPWLEKSAARGEPRAQLVLGTMLFNGDGAPRDYPRAYALMTRASAAGLKSAGETLAQMDQYISPSDRERGLQLARQYEAQARLLPAAQPSRVAARPVAPPPTATPTTKPSAAKQEASKPAPAEPAPSKVATKPAPPAKPAPAPKVAAKPAAPATGGRYRVQLGAFGDAANARALWARVRGRFGGQPSYVAAGGVTRLQAGSFPSPAAAKAACAKAGLSCVVVK